MMASSQSEGGTRESTGWGVEPVPWPVWIRSEGIGPAGSILGGARTRVADSTPAGGNQSLPPSHSL